MEAATAEYLAGLQEGDLRRVVSYVNFQGETWAYPLDAVLWHLVNHGTYHRGQLAHVLRQLGQAPPTTDYLVFVDEIAAGPPG